MSRFENLDPHDFEHLMAHLLGKVFDRRFEVFAEGPDGSIDLRSTQPNLHIVQCKRYERSTFSQLNAAAKREEERLRDLHLRPDEYTFATTLPLTPDNKNQLVATLRDFVKGTDDILGLDDLERLLNEHPEVEEAHPKLWLASAAVSRRIMNAEYVERTDGFVDESRAMLPRYVRTRSFDRALALLAEHHVVIIAGPPGIGKTTLARMLMLESIDKEGYTPWYLRPDKIRSVWKTFDKARRQVFFIDDFFGQTDLVDRTHFDTRDLMGFINRVRTSEHSRLILATREHVLQRAREKVEDLWSADLEVDKFALTLSEYSRADRAQIFYNHVRLSPVVDHAARRDLLERRGYLKVVDHENYTPLLMARITGLAGQVTQEDRDHYTAFCLNFLDAPDRRWDLTFDRGLTEDARRVLLLLPAFEQDVDVETMEAAFLHAVEDDDDGRAGKQRFIDAVKSLEGHFTSSYALESSGRPMLAALNPSVLDFAQRRLTRDPARMRTIAQHALFFKQAWWLVRLWTEAGKPDPETMLPALGAMLSATVSEPRGLTSEYSDRLRLLDWVSNARFLVYVLRDLPDLRPHLTGLEELDQALADAAANASSELLLEFSYTLPWMSEQQLPCHATAVAVARAAVEGLPYTEDFDALLWQAIAAAHPLAPNAVPPDAWAEVVRQFRVYREEALRDPSAWFTGDLGLTFRMFRDIADAVGLPVAPADQLDVMARLDRERKQALGEPIEPPPPPPPPPPPKADREDDGDGDAEIRALFETLEDDDLPF